MLDRLTEYGVVDSTLVYASSEMGNPALHSTRNVPTVLAGGVNGKFRMGRRIKAPADCPSSQAGLQTGRRGVQWNRKQPPAGLDRAGFRRCHRQLRHTTKRRRQERPVTSCGCVIETPFILHLRNEPTSLPRGRRTGDCLFERERRY